MSSYRVVKLDRTHPSCPLKPCYQHKATYSRSCTDAPAAESIRWMMYTEVDAAHTDEHRQKSGERYEVEAH